MKIRTKWNVRNADKTREIRKTPRACYAIAIWIFVSSCMLSFPQTVPSTPGSSSVTRHYVGSNACKTCHPQIFARWEKTRMANVVRNPQEHPEAILPDLSKSDPLVTFKRDDIASPAMTDKYKIPNPCTTCHKDKSTAWASQQLKSWLAVSPWRIEQ